MLFIIWLKIQINVYQKAKHALNKTLEMYHIIKIQNNTYVEWTIVQKPIIFIKINMIKMNIIVFKVAIDTHGIIILLLIVNNKN